MTLNITSSAIKIKNATGSDKVDFSSEDLVYKVSSYSGTISLTQTASNQSVSISALGADDFAVSYVTITAAVGNGATPLVNMRIPASGAVYHHCRVATSGTTAFVESAWFSLVVVEDQIRFRAMKVDSYGVITEGFTTTDANGSILGSVTFDYEVFVYRNTG
jgi:hypothetical protein|tara:strand:+ start:2013 stop:2498 length:486 start_codon:yes stop_codon:yes gene_type:complete